MPATKIGKAKEERFHIRVTREQKHLIVRAAEKQKTNISDFILGNALSAAEAVVGDKAHFTLGKERWNAFCAALDAPPRKLFALRKLLTEPSVFDIN